MNILFHTQKRDLKPQILSVRKSSALPKRTYFRENDLGIPRTSETNKRGKTKLYSDHKAPPSPGEKRTNVSCKEK